MALALWAAASADAQEIPATPTAGLRQRTALSEEEFNKLSNDFKSGSWPAFVKSATAFLKLLHDVKGTPLNMSNDYILLAWPDSVPAEEGPRILVAVLHGEAVEPYSRLLPGVGKQDRVFEVFVSMNTRPSIESYYVSKPLPDPLLAQLPDVVDKFLGPLFTTLEAVGSRVMPMSVGDAPPVPKNATPVAVALVRQLILPEPRAGVEMTINASLPIDAASSLTALTDDLKRRGFAISPEQHLALDAAYQAMTKTAGVETCTKGSAKACRDALHQNVTDQLAPLITAATNATAIDAVRSLEGALHARLDKIKPDVVSGRFSIDNSPEKRLGVGLVSAYAAGRYGRDQRVTVDGNQVSIAELPRAIQMVVVNFTPWGFQEKTARRWNANAAVRPFAGVVFSPDIGVSVGVSGMLLSNLGVSVGYARLFMPTPKQEVEVGVSLTEKNEAGEFRFPESLRRDPVRFGQLGVLFVGVSYNFK